MGEWRETTVGELTVNFDSRRRPVKSSDRRPGPFPYYGASGVVDYVDDYIYDGQYLLISEDGENLKSRSTPIAFIATGQFWVNNHAHVVQGAAGADTRFLAYLLAVTDVGPYISGSAQPKLSRASLDAIRVRVPDSDEQRAIAEVLGALDDKIAVNTRLAATADELVRAEWAGLCDASTEDRSLGQIADLVRSQVDPRTVPEQVPYVGLEHIPRRSMWLGELGSAGAVTSAKSRFLRDDVLFGKLRPYFHKVVGAPDAGICSTDVLVLRSRTPDMAGFLLAAVASDEVVAAVTASSEGTRMPRASWKDLAAVRVAWPGEDAARSFSTSVDAVRRLVEARARETASLAAARDALLPALMSGALRVKDAERLAEDLA